MPHADYNPQLATLVRTPPSGDEWLHEIKFDGYRIGCLLQRGRVTLLSRNGKDWTATFPEVAEAARRLGARHLLLDGEVAIVLPDGRTSFQALQNALAGDRRAGSLVYFVFDLLRLDDEQLDALPLEERKRRLRALVGGRQSGSIRYSEHVEGRGDAVFAEACRVGLEGIISKTRHLPYRPGRRDGWTKTKCVRRQEFVIGGFTDPEGSRVGIGALLIGYFEDGRLVFAGKVGTGFTHASATALRTQLEARAKLTAPFDPAPRGVLARRAHWVRPELVCEVAFTEWTGDGKIRHPSFQGLRGDKPPTEIRREQPAAAPPAAPAARSPGKPTGEGHPTSAAKSARRAATGTRASADPPAPSRPPGRPRRASRAETAAPADVVHGVRITHPHRMVYPQPTTTKLDLARYYTAIADWIVPHLADRPLTLVRCPEGMAGKCFYMKHSKLWAPEPLRRVQIAERTKTGDYLIADSIAAVIGLVQMGVLEIHTWNSRFRQLERPDRLVIDLDPGERVAWPRVAQAARTVRDALAAVDLDSFLKTTGGKGLHVVVPLVPQAGWDDCLAFARALSEALERAHPDAYTTQFSKRGREDQILIDYLRNNRANTSIAAYSTRAREGAPVSMPLAWDELGGTLDPKSFTVATIPKRLAKRTDPWHTYWTCRQKLTAQRMRAVRAT